MSNFMTTLTNLANGNVRYGNNNNKGGKKHHNNNKGGYGYNNHNNNNSNISLKKALKPKALKQAYKNDELEELLDEISFDFASELIAFHNGKSKVFEDREDVADIICNEHFAKGMCSVMKSYIQEEDEDSIQILYPILFTISDLYLNGVESLDEVIKKYLKIFVKLHKSDISKLSKILECSADVSLKLLLTSYTMPSKNPGKSIRFKVNKTLAILYTGEAALEDLSDKKLKKVFKILFKKCDDKLVLTILNQAAPANANADYKANFSRITNFVLDILESADSSDRKAILKQYAKQRQKNVNGKRRINLVDGINEEDYKRIKKTINGLISNGMAKELFK